MHVQLYGRSQPSGKGMRRSVMGVGWKKVVEAGNLERVASLLQDYSPHPASHKVRLALSSRAMIKRVFMEKVVPLLSIVAGVLGIVYIPNGLKNLGEALGDWMRFLPFGPEMAIYVAGFCAVAFGTWQLFRLQILPAFAHQLYPWKNDRISVVELARIASMEYDWRLPDSLEILDLIDGLGQALADGTIHAHGRLNPQRYTNLRAIYLVPIAETHWRRNRFEAFDAIRRSDNLLAATYRYGDSGRIEFMDVHLNQLQARAWLAGLGKQWKGQAERKDQEKKQGKHISRAA
jgi:hypothetical protein